jgi:uncharacterized protein
MELESRLILNPQVSLFRQNGGVYAFHPLTRTCISMNEAMLAWLQQPDAVGVRESPADEQLRKLGILIEPRASQVQPRPAPAVKAPAHQLAIFVTSKCNLRCAYCYANGGDSGKTISREIWLAAMDYFFSSLAAGAQSRQAPKTVSLSIHGGGEATVEFDLLREIVGEFNTRARSAGLRTAVRMGSNGTYSDEVQKWILKNNIHVNISLDGPREVQDRLRPFRSGQPSYDAVVRNLKALVRAGRKVWVRSTVTAGSLDSMLETVELASQLGIAMVHFEPVSLTGRCDSAGVIQPPADEFAGRFLQCFQRGLALDVGVRYSGMRCFDPYHRKFCAACGDNFCVTRDGNITTCYEVLDSCDPAADSFFIGKVDPIHGTVELNHDRIARLDRRVAQNMEACKDCFLRYQCAGDCPLKSYLHSNRDLYSPDPYRCQIARRVNQQLIAWLADGVIQTRDAKNSTVVSFKIPNQERKIAS